MAKIFKLHCPNLALKRIWVHFIEAKAFYVDSEREKKAVLLEEMRGNQTYGLL